MGNFLKYAIWGKRRAAKLSDNEYHDIGKLWEMRVITVEAKGKSITEIYVDAKNRLDRSIKVLIPHGTYFKARGTHQNMAVRKELAFVLKAMETRFLNVPACCINAERPIPGKTDFFKGVKRVPHTVERFLQASEGSGAMVIQAGVWALTNNYSRGQIKNRLVRISLDGRSQCGISDHEINRAKEILDRLGILSNLR